MSEQSPRTVTAAQIDAWLPQTQCTQCGYPRCRAYAEAVAAGSADINQCPPGAEVTIRALAGLLQRAPVAPDPRFGIHRQRTRAVIDETLCIGCRLCIDACPVDAILGARKLMHTVIAHECTGCELCLPPCPVNCIALVPVAPTANASPWPEYSQAECDRWRLRTERRQERLARHRRGARAPSLDRACASAPVALPPLPNDRDKIRSEIRAAVARARARKARRSGPPS